MFSIGTPRSAWKYATADAMNAAWSAAVGLARLRTWENTTTSGLRSPASRRIGGVTGRYVPACAREKPWLWIRTIVRPGSSCPFSGRPAKSPSTG